MNILLARYYFIDLFNKFKYIFAGVIIISALIIALQYSPAREFGEAYTRLSEQFSGPFTNEKYRDIEELISKYNKMKSIAYDDLDSRWMKKFYEHEENYSNSIEDSELWEESQKFLKQKGDYGNTVYYDMLILSTLINSYRELSQIEERKIQARESIRRNIERQSSNTKYWALLLKKSESLQAVEFYDMRAINCFLNSYATDWLFFFVMIIVLSAVFCNDYERNRYLLLFSMPISHAKIGIHKVFCSFIVSLLCLSVSTVINLLMLLVHTTNFHSLLQPVQSIESLSNSMFNGSVWEYILLLVTYKTIFFIFTALVVTNISMVCKKVVYSLILSISLVGISVVISELFRYISPYNILSQCNLLNLYSSNTFVAMDDYFVVSSNLVHNSIALYVSILLLILLLSVIIVAFNRRISRRVVSS